MYRHSAADVKSSMIRTVRQWNQNLRSMASASFQIHSRIQVSGSGQHIFLPICSALLTHISAPPLPTENYGSGATGSAPEARKNKRPSLTDLQSWGQTVLARGGQPVKCAVQWPAQLAPSQLNERRRWEKASRLLPINQWRRRKRLDGSDAHEGRYLSGERKPLSQRQSHAILGNLAISIGNKIIYCI